MRFQAMLLSAAVVALASPAIAAPATTYASNSSTAGGVPGNNNYNYSNSDSNSYGSVVSGPGTLAKAEVGALHVSASLQNDVNGETLPLGANASNNNFQRSASAGWNDVFQVDSNTVSNGKFTASFIIDGSNAGLTTTQTGGGFGALLANIGFSFSKLDGDGNVVPLASFTASAQSYGGPLYNMAGGVQVSSIFGIWSVEVPFITGDQIYLAASSRCLVQANNVSQGGTVDRNCDLGHSVYWGGISNVVDDNGQAVADAAFQSQSSFNYAEASPAATPSDVPEPASWAMMVAGFGIVGGALRSRRKVAVSFA